MVTEARAAAAALTASVRSLVIRHLGAIGAALAVLTFAAAGFGVWDMYRGRIRNAEADAHVLSTVLSEHSTRYFLVLDLLARRIRSLANDLELNTRDQFHDGMGSAEAHRLMARFISYLPPGHTLIVFDAKGDEIDRDGGPPGAPFNVADRVYFQYLRDHPDSGPYFDVLSPGRDTGGEAMILARDVRGPGGQFLGVAAVAIDIGYLRQFYRQLNQEHQIEVTLARRDRVLLAHFPILPEIPRAVPAVSRWYQSLAGGGGRYHLAGASPRISAITSIAPVPGYNLTVTVSIPDQVVLAGWRRESAYVMLAAVLLAVMFAVLFDVIERQMRSHAADNVALSESAAALRASEVRLRDFLDLASDWLWERDADLRLAWVSSVSSLPGPDSAARLGKLRWEFQDTSHDPAGWERHRHDLEAHRPFHDFRYPTADRDSPPRYGSISGRPRFDASGAFIGYRGIGRDITPEIAAERAVREAKERAERAETLLRDALDSISESLTIWNPEDRLVAYNEVWARRYLSAVPLAVPGIRFIDLMRPRVAAGEFPEAIGREEKWLAESLRRHHVADGAYEQVLTNGRWMRVTHRRMRDGGIVILHVDITASKLNELALGESEARSERAQAAGGIGIWEMDVASRDWYWSKQIYRTCGLESPSPPAHGARVTEWLADLETGVNRSPIEVQVPSADGKPRIHRLQGQAITGPDGRVTRLVGTVQDVTDQRMLEGQLAHARKMEAIGNLTGGLAHDFNNLLGIIVMNLDTLTLLLEDDTRAGPRASSSHFGSRHLYPRHDPAGPGNLSRQGAGTGGPDTPDHDDFWKVDRENENRWAQAGALVSESLAAALSGAGLTQRLLAFARRQTLAPVPVRINDMVRTIASVLRRTLGETIDLSLRLGSDLWPVFVDPVHLESSILNLAVNARDAMAGGGRLFIATGNTTIDAAAIAAQPDLEPGDYVAISVTDTGTGMSPEVKERIFEPFFTTKERGAGTGLGLSMVFGFLRQSNGLITVYSEPGKGTTFHLYLPRSSVAAERELAAVPGERAEGGGETIVVAEDNAMLRDTFRRQLTALNYNVLEAADADGALALLDGNPVDLVLSDVVMPGATDGIALARRISVEWPEIRVVLMSGFVSAKLNDGSGGLPPGIRFVQKPARREQLARAIRDALDEKSAVRSTVPPGTILGESEIEEEVS